ncbi:MAG: hypothetical protein GF320_02310, partial [Armatimonadia bacterium]|nr:hypothetical protein [Armatimonadia bacterium]
MSESSTDVARFELGQVRLEPNLLIRQQQDVIERMMRFVMDVLRQRGPLRERPSGRDRCNEDPCERQVRGFDVPTQVFSILADRGYGKTTALLAIYNRLCRGRWPAGIDEERYRLLMPTIIRPEMMRSADAFFPSLCSEILRAAKDCSRPRERGDRRGWMEHCVETTPEALQRDLAQIIEAHITYSPEAREIRRQLAGDVREYAEKIIRDDSPDLHGYELFSKWVDDVLYMTCTELLVICIDDVDVCPQFAPEVLWVLRTYLAHPRIVVILTARLEGMELALRDDFLRTIPEVFTGGN